MIIRQSALRLVRRALSSPLARPPWQPRFRALATDIDSISSAIDHASQETHSIESMLNTATGEPVLPFDEDAPDHGGQAVADAYTALQRTKQTTGQLGSSISGRYRPQALIAHPPSPADITLELLLASQSHLGHATSLWNPSNQRYIFGIRSGIHIISPDITASHLRRACRIVRAVCERGGLVLFVGTRKGQDRAVVRAAALSRGCHLFDRWIPGSITNAEQILGRCRTKVVDHLDRDLPGYADQLVDQPALRPDLVVCLNPLENYVLLQECGQNNIPTIGIVDTDVDPTWVTYPIPANDDSLRCVQLVAGVLGKAGEEGQKRRLEQAKEGRVTYAANHRLFTPSAAERERAKAVDVDADENGKEAGEGEAEGVGRGRTRKEDEDDG